jgi:hypothetical protein
MMSFACAAVIFGSFSSCPAVAVLRLTLAATGVVALPVVWGLPVVTEGPAAGEAGFGSWANAGADIAAAIIAANRTRCMDMNVNPLLCRKPNASFERALRPLVSQFRCSEQGILAASD